MRSIPKEYRYTNLKERPPSLFFPALVLAVFVVFCICLTGVADAASQAADMTDPAHSNKADPDYSVVFPDDAVNTMTITISPENWETMLANMTELYGEFGSGSGRGNPGQGGAPGGMMSSVDPVYVPADITFNGLEWPDVGIRFKGFNSLQGSWNEGSYKISLKLNFDKFEDEYPEIKNQRFYGFDELNLQGAYNDDSLMRDMVVPSIFRESGVPAPYTAFYRLYVDYGEGPLYFGLYTMVEAVEDTVIETQFEDDSGNLYKPEGTGATFAEGTFDTDSFEKKTNEDEADWSDVEELYTILNSDTRLTNPEQWRSELEAVFDVDEFLRWLATNTVIQNWDTYGGNSRNFYLYTDPATGKITWIPWDNNYALSESMNGGNPGGIPAEGDAMPVNGPAGNATRQVPQNGILSSGVPAVIEGQLPGKADLLAANGFVADDTGQPGRDLPAGMPGRNQTPGVWDRDVPADGNDGNQAPGNGGFGGGMGTTLSLSLDEVGDTWPLIRYLADDPVYYERYRAYLEMVVSTSFEPAKMEQTYRFYHDLIAPYVTGPDGEQEGYTHLDSPEAFDASLDELIDHVNSRYDAVMAFLSGLPTPTTTPTPAIPLTATPTATPTPITMQDNVSPVVSISAPASYATVTSGETVAVTWSATDTSRVAGVTLEYSVNEGASWILIADNLPAAGTCSWTVPKTAGPLVRLKVSATDASGNTGSTDRICLVSQQNSVQVSKAAALSAASTGQSSFSGSGKADLLTTYRLSEPASSPLLPTRTPSSAPVSPGIFLG